MILFRFALWFAVSFVAVKGIGWRTELSEVRDRLRKALRDLTLFGFLPEVKKLRQESDAVMRACAGESGDGLLDFAHRKGSEIAQLIESARDSGDEAQKAEVLRQIAIYGLFIDPQLDNAIQTREIDRWSEKRRPGARLNFGARTRAEEDQLLNAFRQATTPEEVVALAKALSSHRGTGTRNRS